VNEKSRIRMATGRGDDFKMKIENEPGRLKKQL
jgi:hypothetical protein